MSNLSNSLPQKSELSNSLSVYSGELSVEGLAKGLKTIQKSFPALPIDFYDVLTDRIKANCFSDERFADAIIHVIDTCIYPQPTIAQFISFDKRIKLHSYEEMLSKLDKYGDGIWKSYQVVNLPNRQKPVWVHVDEIKYLKP